MGEDRALREARSCRRCTGYGRGLRGGPREFRGGRPGGEECRPIAQVYGVAQRVQLRPDLLDVPLHGVAVLSDQEDPGGLGLRQDVPEFCGAIRGVDGHQRHAGETGGELQDDPLRQVGGPHRDAFPGGVPVGERAGRPAASAKSSAKVQRRLGVGQSGHHRGRVRPARGHVAQRATDSCLQYRHRGVRWTVRRRQSHAGLPRPMPAPGRASTLRTVCCPRFPMTTAAPVPRRSMPPHKARQGSS